MGDMHAPTSFTLRSGIAEGRMVYIGVGGDIDGKVNPLLMVHEGETVQINLINGEGAEHDIVVEQYAMRSERILGRGASTTVSFTADKAGEFIYFCSIPGHRAAGMEGRIQVMPGSRAAVAAIAADIVRDPTDLPGSIHARPPRGATVVDFKIARAGRYTLVDHALSRIERGLVGFLIVDGPRDDEVMHAGPAAR